MTKWVIHFNDGKTLTDADVFPHEVKVLEKHGYTPDDITSVERIIGGKHLTILKSPHLENFWVATEKSADLKMIPGPQPPQKITKRILGCYLKNTDPPIQVRLTMDPRTYNTWLEFVEVKKMTLKGINAKLVNPKRFKDLQLAYQREMIDSRYAIIHHPIVEKPYKTKQGFGVLLNPNYDAATLLDQRPSLKVELIVRNQNVLLGFIEPGEKLKLT